MTQHLPPPPAAATDWAWFLDVDGTLIEIAPTPSAVVMPEELPPLLQRLSDAHGGALALISGRTLDNLRQLVAPFDPPAAGLHGLEWRGVDGVARQVEAPPGLDDIRRRVSADAQQFVGLLLEDKERAVALHYRQAPELADHVARITRAAVANHPGFDLVAGKMVVEIKPKGVDKGSAVAAFMQASPFAGRRPVFVGDDITDEDGFAAANRLGGVSVLVGPARETAAQYHLPDIQACLSWLATAAGTIWLPQMGEGAD
ncbi:MAG TPA: trehalose-phosphatase [Magnetospirillum sp.]|nr:trehalose-phosphatase [Magnetospirillum sp.]